MPKPVNSSRVSLGGFHAAVRVTQVEEGESPDPNFVFLQAEGWEADAQGNVAEGATEAPVYFHTIPLGMVADGQVDVAAVVEELKQKQAHQVQRVVKGRAALAKIPRAPRKGGSHAEA